MFSAMTFRPYASAAARDAIAPSARPATARCAASAFEATASSSRSAKLLLR